MRIKTNWSLREETLKILETDITSLFELIVKIQEIFWEDHKI